MKKNHNSYYFKNEAPKFEVIKILYAAQMFGEIALSNGKTRISTIMIAEDSILLSLNKLKFR